MNRLLVVLFAVCAAACGGNDNPVAPNTAPTTFTFTPTVLGPGYHLQDVTVFQNAVQVRATLTWTNGSKDLDLFWTNSFCQLNDSGFTGAGCQILLHSIAEVGTSEQVTGPAPGGSALRFFVVNYSNSPEPITLTVILSDL